MYTLKKYVLMVTWSGQIVNKLGSVLANITKVRLQVDTGNAFKSKI